MEAMRNKGLALSYSDRLEDALDCYDAVLKNGGNALDWEAKATVLVGLGKRQEALDCLIEAVKMMPLERFEQEIEMLKNIIRQDEK